MTRWPTEENALSRVFLAERANEKFLVGESHLTAQLRKVMKWTAGLLFFSLLCGLSITAQQRSQEKLTRLLQERGRAVHGIVVKKETAGEDDDFHYITYQFQAPIGRSPIAPEVGFTNRVEVSYKLFDRTREGETVEVVYDTHNASTSTLQALLDHPRWQAWFLWAWWTGSCVALALLLRDIRVQAQLCRKGDLIRGRLHSLSTQGHSEDAKIDIRYSFQSPAGYRIESVARMDAKTTNLTKVQPRLTSGDAVVVLYLRDDRFILL